MSARILIVDDAPLNRKHLEARLSDEYFDVVGASNGPDALAICAEGNCDIVLLDIVMPEMDGYEVCRRLKRDPQTHHIPVVMVTGFDQPAERLRALEAGADEILAKPVDERALLTRIRSLTRQKVMIDELRLRAMTSASLGLHDPILAAMQEDLGTASVLIVEDRTSVAMQLKGVLEAPYKVDVEPDPQEALFRGVEGGYDLFVVSLALQGYDGLRLCSQFRSLERTRHVPIITLSDDETRLLRGLDLGVNDGLLRPINRDELLARVRTQLRRKVYSDSLRDNVQASIEMAVVDTLTGLHNRRFFDGNFSACVDQAARKGKPVCLMLLDIDFFKKINDSYGHDAGDQILKTFSARIRSVVRSSDLVCRLGGEEFGILMPDTPIEVASRVAERVRRTVEDELFTYTPEKPAIRVTASIGLAGRGGGDNADSLMRRADVALYQSKHEGRNRVTAVAA